MSNRQNLNDSIFVSLPFFPFPYESTYEMQTESEDEDYGNVYDYYDSYGDSPYDCDPWWEFI